MPVCGLVANTTALAPMCFGCLAPSLQPARSSLCRASGTVRPATLGTLQCFPPALAAGSSGSIPINETKAIASKAELSERRDNGDQRSARGGS